jgi:hypothetical protein
MLLNAGAKLDDAKVPATGRIAAVTPAFYNFIKQDGSFELNSDLAYTNLVKGQVGEVDGVKIIKVPTSYFPAGYSFILAHPSTTVFVNKLTDYKTNTNAPGINGTLIEGRIRYDAFVLDAKKNGLYAHKTTVS